jgi:hypothetical protein
MRFITRFPCAAPFVASFALPALAAQELVINGGFTLLLVGPLLPPHQTPGTARPGRAVPEQLNAHRGQGHGGWSPNSPPTRSLP